MRLDQTVSTMARLKALPAGQSRSADVGNNAQGRLERSVALVAGLLALLPVGGCRVSRTTDTRSGQLSSDAEKARFFSIARGSAMECAAIIDVLLSSAIAPICL
jgi:hypothetical protein